MEVTLQAARGWGLEPSCLSQVLPLSRLQWPSSGLSTGLCPCSSAPTDPNGDSQAVPLLPPPS